MKLRELLRVRFLHVSVMITIRAAIFMDHRPSLVMTTLWGIYIRLLRAGYTGKGAIFRGSHMMRGYDISI